MLPHTLLFRLIWTFFPSLFSYVKNWHSSPNCVQILPIRFIIRINLNLYFLLMLPQFEILWPIVFRRIFDIFFSNTSYVKNKIQHNCAPLSSGIMIWTIVNLHCLRMCQKKFQVFWPKKYFLNNQQTFNNVLIFLFWKRRYPLWKHNVVQLIQ